MKKKKLKDKFIYLQKILAEVSWIHTIITSCLHKSTLIMKSDHSATKQGNLVRLEFGLNPLGFFFLSVGCVSFFLYILPNFKNFITHKKSLLILRPSIVRCRQFSPSGRRYKALSFLQHSIHPFDLW